MTFLLCGFALAVAPGLGDALRAEWRRLLALGLAATLVLLGAVLGAFESATVVLGGTAVAGWCFVAVAARLRARAGEASAGARLRYLAEFAFPIYVLDQPVVVVLAAWWSRSRSGSPPSSRCCLRARSWSRSPSTTSACVPSARRDACSA